MATQADTASRAWVEHNGAGRPVPVGTLVQVRMFNGDVLTIKAGTGTFDLDGTPIPAWRSAGWSAWDYNDGGPMAPKFRSYRVLTDDTARERNAAMFQSWLNVRQEELA